MKTIIAFLIAGCLLFTIGCNTTLEEGGPYAKAGQKADMPFYAVDAAFDIAYSTVDAAFKWERDNRAKLWVINKEIKRTMDKIRPEAANVLLLYSKARKTYLTNATPAGLTDLQSALSKAQQLAATALAVIPKE